MIQIRKLQVKEYINWFELIQISETILSPTHKHTKRIFLQVISNLMEVTWHRRQTHKNISGKTSESHRPQVPWQVMAQMIDFSVWFSTEIKASKRSSIDQTDASYIFSSYPQLNSNRNLHRTPVLAGDVPARSTAWRGGRTQSERGFTKLYCASSSRHGHCPFLPTFHSQVRVMGKWTLSFCL